MRTCLTSVSYLPDLGLSGASTTMSPASLRGYLSLFHVVAEHTAADPVRVSHIIAVAGAVAVFLGYISIVRLLWPCARHAVLPLLVFVPFFLMGRVAFQSGYVLGPALALSLTTLWAFFGLWQQSAGHWPTSVVLVLAWVTLGLTWHSMHLSTLALPVASCALLLLLNQTKGTYNAMATCILMTVVAAATWICMRQDMLVAISSHPSGLTDIYGAFIWRGNLAGPYSFTSTYNTTSVTVVRYATHVATYLFLGYLFLRVFFWRPCSSCHRPLAIGCITVIGCLLGDVAMQALYFAATSTLGPGFLATFTQPLLLAFVTMSVEMKHRLPGVRTAGVALSAAIIASTVLTSSAVCRQYRAEDAAWHLGLHDYETAWQWATDRSATIELLGDSATTGHMQVLRASSRTPYAASVTPVSMDDDDYRAALDGTLPRRGMLLAMNQALWNRHLVFGSLVAWSRYEPLERDAVSAALRAPVAYDDGTIAFLVS